MQVPSKFSHGHVRVAKRTADGNHRPQRKRTTLQTVHPFPKSLTIPQRFGSCISLRVCIKKLEQVVRRRNDIFNFARSLSLKDWNSLDKDFVVWKKVNRLMKALECHAGLDRLAEDFYRLRKMRRKPRKIIVRDW